MGSVLHLWPQHSRLDNVKDLFLDASWEYIACTQWATHRFPRTCACVSESGLGRTDFWILLPSLEKRAYLLSCINVAVGKAFSSFTTIMGR